MFSPPNFWAGYATGLWSLDLLALFVMYMPLDFKGCAA